MERLRALGATAQNPATYPGGRGGGFDDEESDLERGSSINYLNNRPFGGMQLQQGGRNASDLDRQQPGSTPPAPLPPPKLPAIVLHPDLSTVEFAVKEENNNDNISEAGPSTPPASPRTPPAIFSYNGRGGLRRNSEYRRQQRVRRTAPPPALVTVELDGSAPEHEETVAAAENAEEEEVFQTAAPPP
jgi:hypothetical protein